MEEKKPESPDTLAICKGPCNSKKVRNPAGKFTNGRDKKYVNEHGKLWNGKLCPECQANKMRTHQRVKRSKKPLQ